jgi:hypothetical protein
MLAGCGQGDDAVPSSRGFGLKSRHAGGIPDLRKTYPAKAENSGQQPGKGLPFPGVTLRWAGPAASKEKGEPFDSPD